MKNVKENYPTAITFLEMRYALAAHLLKVDT
jgi:hypothetical protein